MQLSVIILNYNVRYFLEQCVLSVENAIQNMDAEIIVVDNNSSDDSCEMMKTRFPNVKLIENKENSGFPKGNNIGVAQAKGEYLCILNPDTVVAEDTFVKILQFCAVPPLGIRGLGIVGCKLVDGTGNFLPESKRGVPTPFVAFTKITGLYKLFPKSKTFGKYYAQHLNKNETGKVDILVGAFMVLKRELYLEVGGFDENCFMYSDDIDLSYMVLQKGKSNYYFHDTTVIHYKGESTVKDGAYMKRFQEAMHFFYKKHFKVSFFFDIFMKIGAFLFVLLKKNKAGSVSRKIEEYILFSEDEKLKTKVENLFETKVSLIHSPAKNNLNSLVHGSEGNIEIIFDNNFQSFKSIIESMERYKNPKCTFKILPKNANFIIGSNTSNDRGEVIKIGT
ncbi:glycosyltransferase family 2 protein [Flavobacterium psychrotolerans]|uniref:Glycosyl transferase family 2 n=1 Tax=Flavobacterium psychrotolerans TaxID=2169410 RepID=A0A2U1JJA5_9FLAO|nr:glycosyltransferase family 2 protein [Flavobacterium psychrotolerans]PWA05095.1 glycosyl transferase family 2 [Flavobacterium psychrotolerans]